MAEGSGLIRRFYEDALANGQLDLVDTLATETSSITRRAFPANRRGERA